MTQLIQKQTNSQRMYNQRKGIDNEKTFSPIVKVTIEATQFNQETIEVAMKKTLMELNLIEESEWKESQIEVSAIATSPPTCQV